MENVSFYFCIAKLYAKFTLPSLKIFFLSENFWFPVEPLVDKKKKKNKIGRKNETESWKGKKNKEIENEWKRKRIKKKEKKRDYE